MGSPAGPDFASGVPIGQIPDGGMLQRAAFPSLKRRGGRDLNGNIAKPPLKGADGVVRPAESSGLTISPN